MAFFQDLVVRSERIFGFIKPKVVSISAILCPYSSCREELIPIPLRSKKCPCCSKEVVVRTHYYTKAKVLLTTADAKAFDSDREKYKYFKQFFESLRQFLGIGDTWLLAIYHEHVALLRKRYTKEPPLIDVVMSISNYLVTTNPSVAATILFHEAIFLFEVGSKAYVPIRKESFLLELQELKRNGCTNVQVNNFDKESCEHCRALASKTMSIDRALTRHLLPCRKCSFAMDEESPIGWCRCSYSSANKPWST